MGEFLCAWDAMWEGWLISISAAWTVGVIIGMIMGLIAPALEKKE